MKRKLQILLLAVGLFSVFILESSGEVGFLEHLGQKALKIINIEKIKHCDVLQPIFSGDLKKQAETVLRVPVVYIENSPLADCYRTQPFLFGFVTLFTVVSLGALGFIFHLIRNDPRFY